MDDKTGDNVLREDRLELERPNISIFGLGYVGAVTAACLAAKGYRVIGIDANAVKTDLIRQGLAPHYRERPSRAVPQGEGSRPVEDHQQQSRSNSGHRDISDLRGHAQQG